MILFLVALLKCSNARRIFNEMAVKFIFLLCLINVALSVEVRCKFETAYLGSEYWCYTSGIDLKKAHQTVTSIVGSHKSGKSNSDVIGIWVKNEDTDYLPDGFGTFFPNVKSYWIENNNNLKQIYNENFRQLPKLKQLYIRNNPKLEVLENGIFDGLSEVYQLSLYHNSLKNIGKDVLTPLKKLEEVDFERNTCINHEYKKHEWARTDRMERIHEVIEKKCKN